MQHDPITDMTRRTQRYWYQDGIWEIGFGLVMALLGGFYLLVERFDWTGPRSIILMVLQALVIVGGFLLINRLVHFLKERITYPRTGYVAYKKPEMKARLKRGLLTALLAVGIAVIMTVVANLRFIENAMPLVTSVVMAIGLIYLGYRFGLLRFYFIAALTMLWGYLNATFPQTEMAITAAFFSGFGVILLVSGLVTLLIYLSRTRPASDDLLDVDLSHENHDMD